MPNELRYSLKEYQITQEINKNHYPVKYWIKNKNLFIHIVFWVWVVWIFLTLFAIFLPISNEQKLGRGAIIVFETVFQYIVRILGSPHSSAPTDVANSVNVSPPLWNYEAYLFLYLTLVVILLGFYCVYLIKTFLEDLGLILKRHSESKLTRIKFFLFFKFAKLFWLAYVLLTLWTTFALLYIKKPAGDNISSWIFYSGSILSADGSKQYFRELTLSGWITAGFNILAALITIFFYTKYCREIFKGNVFFISDLRPQEEKSPTIFIDPDINKEISSSLNLSSNLDYEKQNNPGYIVELSNVNKYFRVKDGIFHALKNINLLIETGDFVVILGYSGSGKTTLLNLLAGIDRPTNGSSVIANCDTTKMNDYALNFFRRKKIGYIFQNYALLPNLTASENISIAQGMDKPPLRDLIMIYYKQFRETSDPKEKKNIFLKLFKDLFSFKGNKKELEEILETLDLVDHKDKYPHTLSGGQQQRVAIARALIKKPDILLADEPTGAVDHAMTKLILSLFHNINTHLKTTVILITHNPLIAKMAKRVLYVADGEIIKDERNPYPQHPNDIKGL